MVCCLKLNEGRKKCCQDFYLSQVAFVIATLMAAKIVYYTIASVERGSLLVIKLP